MDRLTEYKRVAEEIVTKIFGMSPDGVQGLSRHLIVDKDRGHYLVYQTGYQRERWIYGATIHIQVTDQGKVWLHHDGTNLIVADMLEEAGVERSDIVIGWVMPSERKYMEGYALG
ncbi:MAG: element excision factor XisI family protein [Bacteroidota bacterium]